MKKICFITTVNHNIGDDFVREGLKFLISKHFGKHVEFSEIHKHSPITARYGFESVRSVALSRLLDPLLPLSLTRDRILESDIVVQSGAPVYWCHKNVGKDRSRGRGSHCASNNGWYRPLVLKRFARNDNAKLINLAAGTCQRYHSDGKEFIYCSKCKRYIKDLFERCTVTTVRDRLAKTVLNSIGLDAPLIPCSSIFAIDQFGLKPEHGDYVAFNYMDGGGHYHFGQNIDAGMWESTMTRFYWEIVKYQKIVFVCHDDKEVKAAKKIDSNSNIFISNNFVDYLKFYARAKFGIMNRVHGAFLMASFEKPSVIIGSDSRSRMAEMVGLESIFVGDAGIDLLIDKYEVLKKSAREFPIRSKKMKKNAFDDYMKALSDV